MRRVNLLALTSLTILLSGCSTQQAPSSTTAGTSSTPTVSNTVPPASPLPTIEPPPSLDDQAMKLGRQRFESMWVKCGDSYYTKIQNDNLTPAEAASLRHYIQWRDVSFTLDLTPISDVRQMNGIEWDGHITIKASYTRKAFPPRLVAPPPPSWGDWQKGQSELVFVTKSKKGWDVRSQLGSKKPSCQEIGKIPESQ